MRRELISKALKKRLGELCSEGVAQLRRAQADEAEAAFVSRLREQFESAAFTNLTGTLSGLNAPESWMEANGDCLSCLRQLSLGQALQLRSAAPHPPATPFLQLLNAARREPERRFQLLAERYACPLNFALPAEAEIREHVMERLMVQDRAQIERSSIEAVKADDLLLRLNFVALQASLTSDLRFLDAVNYYYELLPQMWQPQAQHGWLLFSYFGLYARALAAWL